MTTTAHGLDELKALAGADLGHTGWREITQDRVNAVQAVIDCTIEVEGGEKPACAAQAVLRYYA